MRKNKDKKTIAAKDLDEKFDRGEDVSEYFDLDKAIRRINVDFPEWMLKVLDEESDRLGINRQALIKVWIGDRIEQVAQKKKSAG